jgi:hypothetical protein
LLSRYLLALFGGGASLSGRDAGTDEESEELICEHADEQYGIEMKLSKLIPQDFTEVCELLRFAIDMREGGFRTDGPTK